jgi:predicted sulfurtransferase
MFAGAVPLNTTKFSDAFPLLDRLVADLPPSQRILTYCTGGIRCVKVNAYLKTAGFDNIGRLEKGIIHYENWIQDEKGTKKAREKEVKSEDEEEEDDEKKERNTAVDKTESIFVGKNFLFDRRRLVDNHGEEG